MSIDSSSYRDRMNDDGPSPEMDRTVERIRAASSIVHNSEFLRTKILQRARQRERDACLDRNLLRAVTATVTCSLLLIFAASKLETRQDDLFHRATLAGMQQRAEEISAERRIALEVSLCEAYLEWRSDLAQRLRNSNANKSSLP